jgi:hypothetical protein
MLTIPIVTSKFTLVATHRALGEVTVTLSATDKKHAFSLFKTLVHSPMQWIISSNVPHSEAPCPGCGDKFALGCRVCNGKRDVPVEDLDNIDL